VIKVPRETLVHQEAKVLRVIKAYKALRETRVLLDHKV